ATASPDGSAAAIPLPDGGSLSAGRYSITDPYPYTISFDAPEGWLACNYDPYEQGVCEALEVGGVGVAFLVVDNVVADPCSDEGLDPAVGPSVDDLVTAISSLSGFEASTPTDSSVGGYRAKRFTVTAPTTSGCQLRTWITPTRTNGVGLREENLILVVDVDGERLMVAAAYNPALVTDAQMQAVEDVIASIAFDP
ncbi:MAG TPA: hypothetical protein VFN76_09260, partial [Candidatus Limnocylindria bacterium]|nr:hypothetical protein [Candidatus Limnocylindria bacterium]